MKAPQNKIDSMKKMQGFTLAEMLIVIVIIGIISAMATPSMMTMIRKNQVQQETRDLLATLSEARAEAVLKRSTINVNWSARRDSIISNTSANSNSSNTNTNLPKATLSMSYDLMGKASGLTFTNSIHCFTLQYAKDATVANSIAISQQGKVQVFKNQTTCS